VSLERAALILLCVFVTCDTVSEVAEMYAPRAVPECPPAPVCAPPAAPFDAYAACFNACSLTQPCSLDFEMFDEDDMPLDYPPASEEDEPAQRPWQELRAEGSAGR
jgi:hypothetical protein